jgi:hypothetical protein
MIEEIITKIRGFVTVVEGRNTDFLGLHIVYDENAFFIDQKNAIEKLLFKFGFTDCNAKKIPLSVSQDLEMFKDSPACDLSEYQSLLGSLSFIASASRPDICFAVNALSRYNHCATKMHLDALKGILKYLKGTLEYRLIFPKSFQGISLCGASDASWSVLNDGKGFSGYAVKFLGCLVIWKTTKQTLVALSSCEAECQAAVKCVRDLIWIRGLIADIGFDNFLPRSCVVNTDSRSLIGILDSLAMSPRTKHYCRLINFIRDEVAKYNISFVHVAGNLLYADALTKSLPGPKLEEHKPQLNLL